ncbi:MAG: hypothetical protein D4R76_01085 [Methylococcus sp.]|jgi:MtN3 and saliva related transmembrane protein|nr:MAG: hypothetical protein D4R76_01085 [Methylococcus sp.]
MITTDLIGSIAGTLTTIAFLPQVLKTYRSRSAKDISLVMFLLFSFGVFLWLLYGIQIQAMPIVISNAVTLALSLSILMMKFWFERKIKRG